MAVVAWLPLLFLLAKPAAAATDPEVAQGIELVDEGDYDGAIFALDAASRRLAGHAERARDLSQADLYLGIAYIGKGHEAAAKAKFREALQQSPELTLSTDKYPPKVIDVFEAARDELRGETAPKAASASPSAPPPKKGGGKALWILGGVAAAGGGIAIAAGGGSSSATVAPGTQVKTDAFSGTLGFNENLTFPFDVTGTGTLEATLEWPNADAALAADLFAPGAGIVGSSLAAGKTSASLNAPVAAQRYQIQVLHRGDACLPPGPATTACTTPFTLRIAHP